MSFITPNQCKLQYNQLGSYDLQQDTSVNIIVIVIIIIPNTIIIYKIFNDTVLYIVHNTHALCEVLHLLKFQYHPQERQTFP